MRYILTISLLVHFSVFGQDTSAVKFQIDSMKTLELKTVVVERPMMMIRMWTPRYLYMSKEDIDEMQANDVGEILQKIQGVNLKSYGGLGGLKTISVRSLGSQHSAIVVDGFSIQNSQTGQVNLAQLQTNNLELVSLGVGHQTSSLIPVSAQIAGNNVAVETFEMRFPGYEDSLQMRSSFKVGSFGQVNGYGSAKLKIKKGFVSGFGNYRQSNGLYTYRVQNGTEIQERIRTNNDYQDQYFGGAVGYEFRNRTRVRVNYKQSKINQGLPGAVIWYNNFSDERLTTADQSLSADAQFSIGEAITARAYANGNVNSMRFLDPTYFNSAGKIDVSYLNRTLNAGLVAVGHQAKKDDYGYVEHKYNRRYFFGLEGGFSSLTSSDSLFANPLRQQISGILGGSLTYGPFNFIAHLSGQFIHETNKTGPEGKQIIAANPYLEVETEERGRFYSRHRLWYRNSLRVPSFNELYYNNIGNTNLNPEKSNQFGYNFSFFPIDNSRKKIRITAATYFNQISDKIVAIPTQNLFVWSIQNVGIVHAYGGELSARSRFAFGSNKKFVVSSLLNYSYQRSLDVTDPNHPTYRHQIAYIPEHTGNADFSVEYKKFGGKMNNYLISKRYSLNENNLANTLYGFAITDFSVFYNLEIKKKQSIRIQLQLKNAFNKSYSYIRSFIMPGRNYLISINYAFN